MDRQELERFANDAMGFTLSGAVRRGYVTQENADKFTKESTIMMLQKESLGSRLRRLIFRTKEIENTSLMVFAELPQEKIEVDEQ